MYEVTPQAPSSESEAKQLSVSELHELGRIGMVSGDRLAELGPATLGDAQSEEASAVQLEALRTGKSVDQIRNPEDYVVPQPKAHQQRLGTPNKPAYHLPQQHGRAGGR